MNATARLEPDENLRRFAGCNYTPGRREFGTPSKTRLDIPAKLASLQLLIHPPHV